MNKLVKEAVLNSDLYIEYLKALNGVFNLTDRELELLATFVKLDVEYHKLPGVEKNVANTQNRKFIINTMHITRDNLSRYIKRFRKDGLLIRGRADNELYVNKILIPDVIGDRVQITIILKLKK